MFPKFFPIDTAVIVNLYVEPSFYDKTVQYCNDHIREVKDDLWHKVINMDHKVLKQSQYLFDYKISTDCRSVSIQMIHENCVEENEAKKERMKAGKEKMKKKCADMSTEEAFIRRTEKKAEQSAKDIAFLKRREERVNAFKKLPLAERERILAEQKDQFKDFPYLEELTPKQQMELSQNNWFVCDPGRRDLLFMKQVTPNEELKNKAGKSLKFSNREYLMRTKKTQISKDNRKLQMGY